MAGAQRPAVLGADRHVEVVLVRVARAAEGDGKDVEGVGAKDVRHVGPDHLECVAQRGGGHDVLGGLGEQAELALPVPQRGDLRGQLGGLGAVLVGLVAVGEAGAHVDPPVGRTVGVVEGGDGDQHRGPGAVGADERPLGPRTVGVRRPEPVGLHVVGPAPGRVGAGDPDEGGDRGGTGHDLAGDAEQPLGAGVEEVHGLVRVGDDQERVRVLGDGPEQRLGLVVLPVQLALALPGRDSFDGAGHRGTDGLEQVDQLGVGPHGQVAERDDAHDPVDAIERESDQVHQLGLVLRVGAASHVVLGLASKYRLAGADCGAGEGVEVGHEPDARHGRQDVGRRGGVVLDRGSKGGCGREDGKDRAVVTPLGRGGHHDLVGAGELAEPLAEHPGGHVGEVRVDGRVLELGQGLEHQRVELERQLLGDFVRDVDGNGIDEPVGRLMAVPADVVPRTVDVPVAVHERRNRGALVQGAERVGRGRDVVRVDEVEERPAGELLAGPPERLGPRTPHLCEVPVRGGPAGQDRRLQEEVAEVGRGDRVRGDGRVAEVRHHAVLHDLEPVSAVHGFLSRQRPAADQR